MNGSSSDRRVSEWLLDGPSSAPDWLLGVVVDHARHHPRRRTLLARWSEAMNGTAIGRPVPVLVRVAILLATLALLVSLATAAFVASRPTSEAPALLPATSLPDAAPTAPVPPTSAAASPATVYTCPAGTDPDRPGPADEDRPPRGSLNPVAIDAQSGRLIATSSDEAGQSGLWTLDLCTNRWSRSPTTWFAGTPYLRNTPQIGRIENMVHDAVRDLTVLLGSRVFHYDAESEQLIIRGAPPAHMVAVYRSATGQIIAYENSVNLGDDGGLWAYEPVADAWRPIEQRGERPPFVDTGADLLAYDSAVDRLILYVRSPAAEVYEFDFGTSTWSRGPEPPKLSLVWGDLGRFEIAYDEAHDRTVVIGMERLIAYDAAAHAWETVYEDPDEGNGGFASAGVSLAFDPVSERIIVVDGFEGGVRAFDLGTREWHVLVEAPEP